MSCFSGNPLEPKAEGNIVQHQLDRLWETVADHSWGNVRASREAYTLLYDNERGV